MFIQSSLIGHVLVLTLDRPLALNAINNGLLGELNQHLDEIQMMGDLRALVLTGRGDRAFSAGADLKERAGMSVSEAQAFVKLISHTFSRIEQVAVPTIAAINGVAFGGGLELALACDMRVIHPRAQVGLLECALGIIPGAGGTYRLPQVVGIPKAKELIFFAARIDAKEAYRIGLANWLTADDEDVGEVALKLANQIAQNAPLSLRAAKNAMRDGCENKWYETLLYTQDRLEGLSAFADKRIPQFRGC